VSDWGEGFGEGLDLVVLVLSRDESVMDRVRRASPPCLRVAPALDARAVARQLLDPTLLTGLVIDAGVAPEERERFLMAVEDKWPSPRTVIVGRRPPVERHTLTPYVDLRQAEPRDGGLEGRLRGFVESCLRWVARYLGYALDHRLQGPLLGLFVASVIRQVPRSRLTDYLGIGESTLKRRISSMLDQLGLGEGGLPRLHTYLNKVASTRVSPWHLSALERGAEAFRSATCPSR